MHISEGVLRPEVLISGYVLSLSGLSVALSKLKNEDLPKVAIFSSAFFVASFIHIPLGPSSVHLLLCGIVGLVLGWQVFPAIFVALLVQGVMFQFGGITSLGVNTFDMALPGLVCYYIFRGGKPGWPVFWRGFFAGFLGVFLACFFTSGALFFSGKVFLTSAKLLFLAHIPVMFVEGIISGSLLEFINIVKPEMLQKKI